VVTGPSTVAVADPLGRRDLSQVVWIDHDFTFVVIGSTPASWPVTVDVVSAIGGAAVVKPGHGELGELVFLIQD
jgi:hypothetical protein